MCLQCLRSGVPYTVSVTPSQPVYFKYSFTAGQSSVVVKIESEDSLCMVFSIQDTKVSCKSVCGGGGGVSVIFNGHDRVCMGVSNI